MRLLYHYDDFISDGLIISHLPDGPTAHFKVSNVVFNKEIKVSKIMVFMK